MKQQGIVKGTTIRCTAVLPGGAYDEGKEGCSQLPPDNRCQGSQSSYRFPPPICPKGSCMEESQLMLKLPRGVDKNTLPPDIQSLWEVLPDEVILKIMRFAVNGQVEKYGKDLYEDLIDHAAVAQPTWLSGRLRVGT